MASGRCVGQCPDGIKVKDVVNSNENEGATNKISLSLDLINVNYGNNFYVGVSKPRLFVLVCF